MTPLEHDVMSIVESKPGVMILTIRFFIARNRYPNINTVGVISGKDGVNEAVKSLKKQGYLKMKNYSRLFVTDAWKAYCRGGKHV